MRDKLVDMGKDFVDEMVELFDHAKRKKPDLTDRAAQAIATGAWIEAKTKYYHMYVKKDK